MAKVDSNTRAHLEWMGFVQPHGLVVSAPALTHAGAILNRNDVEGQALLRNCVSEADRDGGPRIGQFGRFARSVLDWGFSPKFYRRMLRPSEAPDGLILSLPEYGETLYPDYAIRHRTQPKNGEPEWQLLVRTLDPDQGFDSAEHGRGNLDATSHGRMERLLRATGVSAGLLFNGRAVRLISAPRGENSGWMDFRFADMLQTSGRPIVAAMRLLLSQSRLLTGPAQGRLTALLQDSREYQNVVSERLAEQVLHALYELVRGFQAAHDLSNRRLLKRPLEDEPDEVYRAQLTVILRLVFLLYAEQRDLLPRDETFQRYYSLAGLYDRLREDAAQHADTMDQRYGAWAQLVVLFRMIHDGAKSGGMKLPARHGSLFDPSRFQFLSQVPVGDEGGNSGRMIPPLVPDGTVYRVLEKLLILDGERISYRALDVEQIGSVYETMMGFRLETATGPSIAIKAQKKNGAPSTIDLEALLSQPPSKRRKWIQDRTARKITALVNREVRKAESLDDLYLAFERVVDKDATPDRVPEGAMVLQPSKERRASGSHYTPRTLTEPIVRRTLEPILKSLRDKGPPTVGDILSIKVCDPAMGSGAFLVEACRQLADALVEAWHLHGHRDEVLAGEDEVVIARRIVAQRCLYGVDRNVVAVDLAKMSLWLVTLAKDHPLTFLDHALRHGDSLLGLNRQQIEWFHWKGHKKGAKAGIEAEWIRAKLERVSRLRREIQSKGSTATHQELEKLWGKVQVELSALRLCGDLVLSAFFRIGSQTSPAALRAKYAERILTGEVASVPNSLDSHRYVNRPLASFHWETEFPEVFDRGRPGFDAIIGNPPFAGKNAVIRGNARGYPSWLKTIHAESHGNADLAAHFFRRAFSLLRTRGNLGLIATNTIAQGDTRSTGLRWICTNGGKIFNATRRLPWPGQAAVVVSVVHIHRNRPSTAHLGKPDSLQQGEWVGACLLDGTEAESISAFLTLGNIHDDPARLEENKKQSFVGSYVLGMGFTFDDTDKKGVASSLSEMERLIDADPHNAEAIMPYIGGAELNSSPTHAHHRYVINFWNYPLRRDKELKIKWAKGSEKKQAKWLRRGLAPSDYPLSVAEDWPDLLEIVKSKVYPFRKNDRMKSRRVRWWQYGSRSKNLYNATKGLRHVLTISRVGQHVAFTFLPTKIVYAETLIVFPFDTYPAFCALQSRLHEIWARKFGSSMKDDLRYTPSDCFETFPFPINWSRRPDFDTVGEEYYEFRSSLMVREGIGLTEVYNRFHNPYNDHDDIVRLRKLHARMDRTVLDAYGWTDLSTKCKFLLDYETKDSSSRKKRPWRYRWPDDLQCEVLRRLLELNAYRPSQLPKTSQRNVANSVAVVANPGRIESQPTHLDERDSWHNHKL